MFLEVSQNSHENTYARVSFSIKSIEAVVQRCSVEKVFLEILQNLQEITCVRVSILMMLQAWACNFIKKETLAQMFSCEFCEISKKTLFTEISGRLLLCFMTFSDWEFLPQRFKNICCCKIDCGNIIVYQKILSNFRKPHVEQPKQLLHLKKPVTVKFLMLPVQFGLLELISHNHMLF